ncbi:hypothetical protein EMIHUDRAFT_259777 [Emiliania huxleyi CCMP1516]|uniref:Uncharacterized protein n=2 Tax=Emiliania huxleyi TaxID=2903 RepID=A0A0D3HY97_EMIH1|nr:hypothetical protein EMIHUDRAFT_259777 [Emiliania huxleyi CCMP1516]EOD03982.1 hypothetical protein EMIHUDRAFT_259777 [Emiliania huxleyi CCMP1516]|eukprot:XP_005756411.1 hypothetical protein EMIHUDRAFT_259777 [Emiliania huxleyi CCMP1516]
MTVLCIFLWGLLEGLIVKDFIAKVPDKITFWVFPFYVVAFVSNGNKLTENYYAGLYQLRVMLRSLASRPEAGTYAYCTLAYWTILTEIWTVKQRPASQGQMTQAT